MVGEYKSICLLKLTSTNPCVHLIPTQAANRERKILKLYLTRHSMSGLFSNSRDHGLSSDDDESSDSVLIHDGYAQHPGSHGASSSRGSSSSQNRYRGQKSATRGHSSSKSQSSRHTCSTQNSVSLADFDKEYVDMDDDEDDDRVRKSSRGDHRRKGGGGRSRSGADWTGQVTKLLLTSSKWKLALVGLALGLLCAITHQSYLWIKSERSSSGNGVSYLS